MNEGTGQLYAPALFLFLPWEAISLSLSLCHRLRCLALRFSLPPSLPSSLLLSLSRVTSAPGIPRLRRYERQRRKSERASWAAKRRGVVNDSSEPRSAFLPRALSLLPAPPHPTPPLRPPASCFAISSLSGSAAPLSRRLRTRFET